MEDIEIARNTKLEGIETVAKKAGINKEYVENYGKYKAKISLGIMKKIEENKDGKLILITNVSGLPFILFLHIQSRYFSNKIR